MGLQFTQMTERKKIEIPRDLEMDLRTGGHRGNRISSLFKKPRHPLRVSILVLSTLSALLFAFGTSFAVQNGAPQRGDAKRARGIRFLADFPRQKMGIEKWMKENGWESMRDDPSRFEVGNGCLHMVSEKDSVMIGTNKGFPLDPHRWPRIRMRLRIGRIPLGTNLSKKSGDDAAFRLYIAFDRGGGLFNPPHTLAYTWTENLAPETLVESPHFKEVRYLSVGRGVTTPDIQREEDRIGEQAEGKPGEDPSWRTVERDLLKDYRLAFPEDKEEVPQITGIVLKCDSNNTKTSAEAWLTQWSLSSKR